MDGIDNMKGGMILSSVTSVKSVCDKTYYCAQLRIITARAHLILAEMVDEARPYTGADGCIQNTDSMCIGC